jgi:Holliday junction resolvase RusA-like endonuclease
MNIAITLSGQIIPKARPRVTVAGTYMPHNYQRWKAQAIAAIRQQYQGDPIARTKTITITLTGKHSRRGDADNISGSILDSLVQAGVLVNDNLVAVPSLSINLLYSKADPITEILLYAA